MEFSGSVVGAVVVAVVGSVVGSVVSSVGVVVATAVGVVDSAGGSVLPSVGVSVEEAAVLVAVSPMPSVLLKWSPSVDSPALMAGVSLLGASGAEGTAKNATTHNPAAIQR